MNDKLSEQVRLLLEDPPTNEDGPYNLAKNGFQACMDRQRIEQLGVSPLLDTLTQLGVWPGPLQSPAWLPDTDTHWWDIMYALRRMGLSSDILINFSVSTDLRNSSRHIMSLDQPELGLAREFLERGPADPVVQGYRAFMVEVVTLLGVEPGLAEESMTRVLEFEMRLANITMSRERRRDPNHQYNPMPILSLTNLDPATPWLQYISTILGSDHGTLTKDDLVVVGNPDYISNLR